MRFISVLCLISLIYPVSGVGQADIPVTPSPQIENPILDYLTEIDEVGRTLSGWEGESEVLSSWFFSAYAMLILSNDGMNDSRPFSNLGSIIPPFWEDLKYLTPRHLIEIAGGALSYKNIMSLGVGQPFKDKRTEQQFITIISGYSYLRMLSGTVGSAQYGDIVSMTMDSTQNPQEITAALIKSVTLIAGDGLGEQFSVALSSGSWMDAGIDNVKKGVDSTAITIEQYGIWSFPIEVLTIDDDGDSTYHTYSLDQSAPLSVQGTRFKRIILDPQHMLAEFYRFNNKWPKLQDNIFLQPFVALPDWESYRIVVSPGYWSDWNGEKRYALKLTSGFGIDLWPAYPSDFRHRISAEINVHAPIDTQSHWGSRMSYGHPLSLSKRLFANARVHHYDDWSGVSLGITKYIGKQQFLIQGPKLLYQRISLSVEQDSYGDPLIWQASQDIQLLRASYTGLSLTRYGDRLYVNLTSAYGKESEDNFLITKSQLDLSGVFWSWLVGGIHFVSGTQNHSTPGPYQFTHDYAWQDHLAALPSFRGQAQSVQRPHNYLGLSLSGGYWVSWYQVKIFASSMLYDQENFTLTQVKPQYAAGFGFEHKSLFTVGLYFPIWQSRPLEGETYWAWRYQWRFSWNL